MTISAASAANVYVDVATLNAGGPVPAYSAGDTIIITGETVSLNSIGWAAITQLNTPFHLVLNNGTTIIPSYGFFSSPLIYSLLSVTGYEVITVRDHAFLDCYALQYVDFPKATTIEYFAFHVCPDLWYLNLPSVTLIEDGVFHDTYIDFMYLGNMPVVESGYHGYGTFQPDNNILILVPDAATAATYTDLSNFTATTVVAVGTFTMGTIEQNAGDNFTLGSNVTIIGGTYTYIWKKNGTLISGALSNEYSKVYSQSLDAGTYECFIVVNGIEYRISLYTVVINSEGTLPTPTTTPSGNVINGTENVTINHVTPGVTVYWTTDGSNPVSSINNGPSGSIVTISVGQTLRAMAAMYGWDNSSEVSVTYIQKLLIIEDGQPEDMAVMSGDIAAFTVNAIGNGTLTYKWLVDKGGGTFDDVNSTSVPGSSGFDTNTLTISPADISMNGWIFKVEVEDSEGSIHSYSVDLKVVEHYEISGTVDVASGSTLGKSVAVTLQHETSAGAWENISEIIVSAGEPGTYSFENGWVGSDLVYYFETGETYRVLFTSENYQFVTLSGNEDSYSEVVDFAGGLTAIIDVVVVDKPEISTGGGGSGTGQAVVNNSTTPPILPPVPPPEPPVNPPGNGSDGNESDGGENENDTGIIKKLLWWLLLLLLLLVIGYYVYKRYKNRK
ncbi:MAG: chitobiase/beta-hexosaminidase C-terminal domain-containing protein [Methanosarcinales archaeon]|nr:chitobiase/beta-hexosaminidase C-terminal domain-containing protein [Methanosarcinales archaeon]